MHVTYDFWGSIASSTSASLSSFSTLFTALAGLLLAMAVISFLVFLVSGRRVEHDFDPFE